MRGIFISIWRRGFGYFTQEFVVFTCVYEGILILSNFFWLINCFLFFPIFQASHSNKGSICLIEGCTQQTSLSLPMLALGWSYLLRSSSTWWIVSYRFHIFLCSYLPISSSNRQIVSYRIYIFWCWTIFHGLHIDFWMFCH